MVRTMFNVSIYLQSLSICFLYLRTESIEVLYKSNLKISLSVSGWFEVVANKFFYNKAEIQALARH